MARILIACIGNIFLGDDAFGVEVAQRLAQRTMPDGVRVVDFGIRGFDLAYALLDDYDATIMVDATPQGGEPGTLYVIEPDFDNLEALEGQVIETHGMHPLKVLSLVKSLGGQPKHLLLVGCEPGSLGTEDEYMDGYMGLSEPVQLAVDGAIGMIESLVEEILGESRKIAQEV